MTGAEAKKRGLLLRVGGELRALPAPAAVRVVSFPPVTRVPGGPPELLGVALYEGGVVPVVALGPSTGSMVVCSHAGELLGLVGAEVSLADPSGDAELYAGLPEIDLGAIYAALQPKGKRAPGGRMEAQSPSSLAT